MGRNSSRVLFFIVWWFGFYLLGELLNSLLAILPSQDEKGFVSFVLTPIICFWPIAIPYILVSFVKVLAQIAAFFDDKK